MNHRDGEPPILGIDLGTSTCLACVMQGDSPLFIRPDQAFPQRTPDQLEYPGHLMPSVFCNRDGEELAGYRALAQMTDPNYVHDVVLDVKSRMKWDDEPIRSGGRDYPPSRIAGVYIKTLLVAAERQLGLREHTIASAVVTVPTAFGSNELGATRRACGEAGLLEDNVWLVDEPVAAAYSLGLHRQPGSRLVLVGDLGGGTFDATLLRVGKDVSEEGFVELGREGDANLGGKNWDYELADWVARKTLGDDGEVRRWLEGRDDYRARHYHLLLTCERTKIDFFNRAQADRGLSLRVAVLEKPEKGGSRKFKTDVGARWFLDRTEPLVEQCVLVCKRLFDDVSRGTGQAVDWADIDHIYLAGGGSKMWTVRDRFAGLWGREPTLEKEPQYAVAKGAALIARAIRDGMRPTLVGRRRYPNGIGIHTRASKGGPFTYVEIVPRNRIIPFDPVEYRFSPVSGGDGAYRLRVPIVERRLTLDGPVEVPIQELTLVVPPAAMRGRDEEIVIRVGCDNEDCRLDYRIGFRNKELSGSLSQEEIKGRVAGANGWHQP